MTIEAERAGESPAPWYKRVGWFVGLWAAGVLAVGSVGYFIRWWLVG